MRVVLSAIHWSISVLRAVSCLRVRAQPRGEARSSGATKQGAEGLLDVS